MTLAFDVLNPQQKIYGNFFLEASAGTGKTFTIAHLVLRLICESSPAISISKIGVVTFTKAAAFELKTRIKELLINVKEDLENDIPTFINEELVDKKEIIFRLKLALLDFDFAPIATIHGFCYHILQKHGPILGLKPMLQNPEETSLEALCYDHIKEFLKSEKLTSCLCRKQKEALLSSKRGDLHALILSLKQIILSGIDIEDLPTWDELKKQIKNSLKDDLPDKEKLISYINRYKLSPITKEEALSQLESLYTAYHSKETIEELLIKKPFWDYLSTDRLKVKASTEFSKEVEVFFKSFQLNIAPLIKEAIRPSFSELKLAKICKESFEKLLKEKGLISFSSMLKNLDNALKEPASTLINLDFTAMIIDEFQDTDPIQWSILKKLFVDHPVKAFYMVGDPKQAIYGFRSADVYTYIQVKKECPYLNHGTLDTSFRSTPKFIEALNIFLSKAIWLKLPFLNESYPYNPVKSGKKSDENKSKVFTFYKKQESLEAAESLSSKLALTLSQTHQKETVAILVKDRFQLERIETLLKTYGIPYESIKNEMLDGSIIFELLEELLILLDEPLSKGSLNRFMASPWLNYNFLDFEKKKQELIKPEAFKITSELKMVFHEHGFLAAIEKLLTHSWPEENQSIRLLIASLFGPDIIDKLFEIGLLIHNKSVAINNASHLRLELHLLKKDNVKISSLSSNDSNIKLLTSHMSKGLEYDHVIALGIATRYEKPPEIILKRIDNSTYLGLVFKDQLSFDALHDLDMEKIRQLYVATTRAKKSLHIPIINYSKQGVVHSCLSPLEFYILMIKHGDLSYKELYSHVLDLDLDKDIPTIFNEASFEFKENIEDISNILSGFYLPILDKSLPVCQVVEDKVVSFSSLKTDSDFEKTDDPLRGRAFGDFFHMLMQELLKYHYYQDFLSIESKNYFEFVIDTSPFNEHKTTIMQYLQSCLTLQFPTSDGEFFCIKDVPPSDLYIETPFCYHTELGKMKGVIDCTVVYKNKLYFIDWKTSFLKDTTHEGLASHMKKASYDLQLDIYKTALLAQKDYFNHIPLSKAFYVFVKQAAIFEKNFEEASCLL